MIETTIEGQDFTRISARVYNRPEGFVGIDVENDGRGGREISNLSFEQAHALADWIIANVPKPEPTPLPTKFAAVVKTPNGDLWTLAALITEPGDVQWVSAADYENWTTGESLREWGFEVIFAGVDD